MNSSQRGSPLPRGRGPETVVRSAGRLPPRRGMASIAGTGERGRAICGDGAAKPGITGIGRARHTVLVSMVPFYMYKRCAALDM
eukprot:scaffold1239_cov319-Prasinococcus_capsulatus_cf.AAC.5